MTSEATAVVPTPCPFCDRSGDAERIVMENDELYVVPTFGQITDGGYLLVIPKAHISCLGAMTLHAVSRFEATVKFVRAALSKEYEVPVVGYEHGIVGQTVKHAHYHLVPSRLLAEHPRIIRRITEDFPGAPIGAVSTLVQVAWNYHEMPKPYLLWNTGDRYGYCLDPPAKSQYLRIVAADTLGRPERANWRQMDPELDRRLIRETTARMRPHLK